MFKLVITSVFNAYRSFESLVSELSGTNQPPRLGYFNGRKRVPVRVKSSRRSHIRH